MPFLARDATARHGTESVPYRRTRFAGLMRTDVSFIIMCAEILAATTCGTPAIPFGDPNQSHVPMKTVDRLFEETALFLHRRADRLPEPQRRKLEEVTATDPLLEGKTVLIIDDDVRNVFALTSLFERYHMKVEYADNATDGLKKLAEHPEVQAALVDIMMPDIDGYETIRRIRSMPGFAMLPVFALTAKAMKGDREACLKAGATDYVAKPADPQHLISLLRVHVARKAS